MTTNTDGRIVALANKVGPIVPRVIRMRDAPTYLGMDRNRFNLIVRPRLTEVSMGIQGLAFDRLDLDAWWEQYKSCNGRPAARRNKPWDKQKEECLVSSSEAESGISTRKSEAAEFAKALESATSGKRRST